MEFSDLTNDEQTIFGILQRAGSEAVDLDALSKRMRMTRTRLDRHLYRLVAYKFVHRHMKAGQHFFEVGPAPEPKRAWRQECPRCGVVNCNIHTASRLTNGRASPASPLRF